MTGGGGGEQQLGRADSRRRRRRRLDASSRRRHPGDQLERRHRRHQCELRLEEGGLLRHSQRVRLLAVPTGQCALLHQLRGLQLLRDRVHLVKVLARQDRVLKHEAVHLAKRVVEELEAGRTAVGAGAGCGGHRRVQTKLQHEVGRGQGPLDAALNEAVAAGGLVDTLTGLLEPRGEPLAMVAQTAHEVAQGRWTVRLVEGVVLFHEGFGSFQLFLQSISKTPGGNRKKNFLDAPQFTRRFSGNYDLFSFGSI